TAATGGSFFEIGGVVAGAISGPAGGPPCGHGGTCGVPGLVAVAQATPGSIENLRMINGGQIESGFAQADLAGWAYHGIKIFAETGPQRQLRTIASLFPEAAHLVVRADSPIHKLADLKGKRISLGESGSGTAADAAVFLVNAGTDSDLVYAITQSLWNQDTRRLLDGLDPLGKKITLDHALNGVSVPLHDGAARFYQERGLPVENAPRAADAGSAGQKQP